MRQSRRPSSSAGSPLMEIHNPIRVAIKILYTPAHDGYLASETEKQVEAFIADETTVNRIYALMDLPAFKALVQSEAKKLLTRLEPALQRGFEAVSKSFSLSEAHALRDMVERTLKDSKQSWAAMVAFFVFAGEAQLKGKAKSLARKVWMDEGLFQHPVVTDIECPNCGAGARLAVHLSSTAWQSPERWEIDCPSCHYRDLSLPSSPRSETLKPATDVEIRRWLKLSPAIADQHPFMEERCKQLLSALRRQTQMLRSGVKAELAQFASAVQQELITGRPAKNKGFSIFLMQTPILATELNTAKVGRPWPRNYSSPTVAEEVMYQAGADKQITMDSPAGSFDQHWEGQFDLRVMKLDAALEKRDTLEAAVQAYALYEDAWLHGLLAPFTLSVKLPNALAGKILVAETVRVTEATPPAASVPPHVIDGLDIEDLSKFLAAAMNSMSVTVNSSAVAALLRAYVALRKG